MTFTLLDQSLEHVDAKNHNVNYSTLEEGEMNQCQGIVISVCNEHVWNYYCRVNQHLSYSLPSTGYNLKLNLFVLRGPLYT
jgi:hypothetical protein